MDVRRIRFSVFAIVVQVLFIIIFAIFGKYADTAKPVDPEVSGDFRGLYPYFQDVHVMIFIGFGFLMTFLKRYGYGAVSINLLIASFCIQWAIIVRGFIHHVLHGHGKFPVHLGEMLTADFASATVLISFGACLGKTSPLQLLIMGLIEVLFAQINEYIGLDLLGVADIGESMFIHAFGAYFGLACARVLYNDNYSEARSEGAVYHSDIFSMIGTVFLWIFWPSFNGGAASGDEQERAVMNTYLSLTACTVITFAISQLVEEKGRFDMLHVQNATLAGGVALGTSANMPLQPWASLLIGSIAGIISVIGFKYITPFMKNKLKIHDTCGVNNLHGMPGILAGIVGAVAAAMANVDGWGASMYEIFPATIPMDNTTAYEIAVANFSVPHPGAGRSGAIQGGFQMLALVITLVISIVGGLLAGILMRLPCLDNVYGDKMFDDREFFIVDGQGFPENETSEEGRDANAVGMEERERMME